MDETDAKKQLSSDNSSSVASRRPVRRKTKPKNADFEYDLSNLLKMEAQGYRDSLTMASAKTSQTKKKVQEIQMNYDNFNKDCCGALVTMSKKSVERAAAHIKTDFSIVYPQKDARPPNIFVRPMLPKIISRGDKISPKKDNNEDAKESPSPSPVKEVTTPNKKVPVEDVPKIIDVVHSKAEVTSNTEALSKAEVTSKTDVNSKTDVTSKTEALLKTDVTSKMEPLLKTEVTSKMEVTTNTEVLSKTEVPAKTIDNLKTEGNSTEINSKTEVAENTVLCKEQNSLKSKFDEIVKPKSLSSIVPLKFRRQSLEVMKNPIINKNITDFTKSGLKTKILVIKPINRNKDGTQTLNTSLKFQTIKLKDPNKRCSRDDQDQVVVVKVPKVDCTIARPITDVSNTTIETSIGAPSNMETNKPTDVEECTSNDNEDTLIKNDESCTVDDVAISEDVIEEPVADKDTSENVNTTV